MAKRDIDERLMLELKNSGVSIQEIAEQVGVSKNTIIRRLKGLDVSWDNQAQWTRRAQIAAGIVATMQEGLLPVQLPSRLHVTRTLAEANGIRVPAAARHLRRAVQGGLLVEIDLGGRARLELPGAPADMRPLYAVPENAESPQTSDVFRITDLAPEKLWGLSSAVLITTPAAAARIVELYTA